MACMCSESSYPVTVSYMQVLALPFSNALCDTDDSMNICIWQFSKISLHSFRHNDDAINIYSNLRILCHMLSVTLMIQEAYTVDL